MNDLKNFLELEIKKIKIQLEAYELLLEKLNNQQTQTTGTIELGILVRDCPVCGTRFNTLEQRKIYCSNACKTKSCRERIKC